MNNLWALVIGIERYAGDVVEHAAGALVDVQRIYEWLREIGVPADHIIVLQNEEATRQIIIETFQSHLIDNPRIQDGDPMLLYFSGHGSRTAAPASWPSWNETEIEMIIPYDAVRDPTTRSESEITGIPDRTLGSLIRKSARRHGRNFTVILDCCASGHGTRGGRDLPRTPRDFRPRTIRGDLVGRLTEDTDRAIWQDDAPTRPRVSYLRGAFVDRQDDSHVLLAACGRKEESNGTPRGGWFTTALLEALRDPELHPRSYSEIIKHVRKTFDGWYSDFQQYPQEERPDPQTPQCEGTNRDRVIFQNMMADSLDFAVQPTDGPRDRCTIEAGAIRGVCPGTIFELRQYSGNVYTPITSAVAAAVHPGHSTAILPSWMTIPRGVRAYVSNFFNPLKFAVVNLTPEIPASVALYDRLTRRIARMSPEAFMLCSQVPSPRDAEIVFIVEGNEVVFNRRDTKMSYLSTTPPRVNSYDIDIVFPDVIAYVSRFNFYLHQDNPLHPLTNDVEVRLHRLCRPPGSEHAGLDSDIGEDEFLVPEVEIPFIEQEATVEHQEDAYYGLVLHNYTNRALYPYVLFFDPATYEVVNYYSPLNADEPPLQPGGQLQLGSSSESLAAMSFVVGENQTRDTGFLKIYFSTEPVKVNFMEQGAILNTHNVRGAVQEVEAAQDPQPLAGVWDVITRKVTVILNS